MKRPIAVLASCLVLAACGDSPADDAAHAACEAYGDATSGAEGADALVATALEQAHRAADANDSFAALQRDMVDARSGAEALAAAQTADRSLSGGQVDAYFAADEQVRADCAAAGKDSGPLRP